MKRSILVGAALLVFMLPALAGSNANRNNSGGKRPVATYSAGGSNGSATRQTHTTRQRPVQVQPAYSASAPKQTATTTSSSTRYQFTEVAPRSLY